MYKVLTPSNKLNPLYKIPYEFYIEYSLGSYGHYGMYSVKCLVPFAVY